jgi:hypothetical protein
MKRWFLLAVAAVLAATACGVTSGIVTGKQYDPPYSVVSSTCVSYNKSGACTLSMPTTQYYPAAYWLCLRDDKQDRPADKQDTGCIEVSPSDYDRYKVGERYP